MRPLVKSLSYTLWCALIAYNKAKSNAERKEGTFSLFAQNVFI